MLVFAIGYTLQPTLTYVLHLYTYKQQYECSKMEIHVTVYVYGSPIQIQT